MDGKHLDRLIRKIPRTALGQRRGPTALTKAGSGCGCGSGAPADGPSLVRRRFLKGVAAVTAGLIGSRAAGERPLAVRQFWTPAAAQEDGVCRAVVKDSDLLCEGTCPVLYDGQENPVEGRCQLAISVEQGKRPRLGEAGCFCVYPKLDTECYQELNAEGEGSRRCKGTGCPELHGKTAEGKPTKAKGECILIALVDQDVVSGKFALKYRCECVYKPT